VQAGFVPHLDPPPLAEASSGLGCRSPVAVASATRDADVIGKLQAGRSKERPASFLLRQDRYIFREFMREPPAEFDRDEVLVCMVLAFCIASASIDVIYKLFS